MPDSTQATARWRTRPVFISSTFKDMHAERDYLRTHVFPELEERLRERRHHLEPIDLRVGVETVELASEEAKELQVLKVCLDEIKRSRPFLIVLLGDRYGWVPPEDRMATAAREAGFPTMVAGRSVTDLEIEFGILKESPEQRHRSFFYFRAPLPYAEMPPEIAAQYSDEHSPDPGVRSRYAKLQALKARVAGDVDLGPRVRRYHATLDPSTNKATGLEEWGRQVLDDLWTELDHETHEFARQPSPSWESLEREALAAFVEDRSRDFVGRQEITTALLSVAHSPARDGGDWGACVTGAPGSGKSALFAHCYRQLQQDPTVLLLAHAAGISDRSTQVVAMLRRWIHELAEYLEVPEPLAESASVEDVEEAFARLLSRATASQRVVLLIDALNQFEATTRARHLTWLPSPRGWPENARLIAFSLPGEQSEALGQWAGVLEVELPALTHRDAAEIAQRACARYHRQFHPLVLKPLLSKRLPNDALASGNPLWLTLAMEELNLLDADEFARAERQFTGTPDERLHQLLLDVAVNLPPDVEGLYGWMLGQAEKAHGEHWTRALANLIALSRFGWRESDLRTLVPVVARLLFPDRPADDWDALKFASLRRGFRAHLVHRGGQSQWDFFHTQTRLAVNRRNLPDQVLAQRIHRAIADHLEALPPWDPVRHTELMVHLIGADDRLRAARYYGGPMSDEEEVGATRALAAHMLAGAAQEANPGLAWVVSLLSQPGVGAAEIGGICTRLNFDLNDALQNEANLSTRLSLLHAAQAALTQLVSEDPRNAEWQRDLSVSHERIGDVLRAQGDLAGALQAYRAGLAIGERLAAQDPRNAGWQRDLSVSHVKIGDVLTAQGDLGGALSAYRAGLAIGERLAAQDPRNAEWQRDLWVSCWRIADMLGRRGDPEASRWWRRAYDILSGMKRAGLFISDSDEGFLEQLRQKAGGREGPSIGFGLHPRRIRPPIRNEHFGSMCSTNRNWRLGKPFRGGSASSSSGRNPRQAFDPTAPALSTGCRIPSILSATTWASPSKSGRGLAGPAPRRYSCLAHRPDALPAWLVNAPESVRSEARRHV